MEKLKVALILGGTTLLGACVPGTVDMADQINLACQQQNQQGEAIREITLATGQRIAVATNFINVEGPGILNYDLTTKIQTKGDRTYLIGYKAYALKWYEVQAKPEDALTKVTVRHNCAKPESLPDLINRPEK